MCIAHDLARLRDIAASLASPSAAPTASSPGPVRDQAEDGRRNRYQIQAHLPLPEVISDRSRDHGGAMMCRAAGSPRRRHEFPWSK
jgi:hypothetical protein